MVILRSQNKITDFLIILAWASPFNGYGPVSHIELYIIGITVIDYIYISLYRIGPSFLQVSPDLLTKKLASHDSPDFANLVLLTINLPIILSY